MLNFEPDMRILGFNISREERKAPATYGGLIEQNYVLSQAQSFFSGLMNPSGQVITDQTAIMVSSFYSCLRNISEDTAKVPFRVFQYDSKGNKSLTKHRASALLNKMPSNLSTPFTFRQTLIKNALLYGNGYALIKRDKNATPTDLYIINPKFVTVSIIDQRLYYLVNDIEAGIIGNFSEDNIFHVRGMGDGYVGKSILVYGAESIGSAKAVQTYASSFFGTGATLGGYIEVPGVVKDENQAKSIVGSFSKSYKTENGSNNGIALLHSGAKFQKLVAQPNESQMVETREFNVADIARWFRMPLSKLQAGATGSSNLEQLNIEYVTDCLMPWFVKLEQEIERKLFRFDEMDLLDARFEVAQLMRGDSSAISTYLQRLRLSGFITANEGRKYLDLNTVQEDSANKLLDPVNMIPADMSEEFWQSKDQSQASQKGPDNGGTN